MNLVSQVKANALALLSLCVALYALGYNTWRNEVTEYNRNIRFSGFEMLVHISELQRISYLAHYDKDLNMGNPRKGWTEALQLRDLSQLMPKPIHQDTEQLINTWERNWKDLHQSEASVQAIDHELQILREAILDELRKLE
ncbi:MAG: hypothetical protein V3U84_05000 [Thiotrichaceae bacterium]